MHLSHLACCALLAALLINVIGASHRHAYFLDVSPTAMPMGVIEKPDPAHGDLTLALAFSEQEPLKDESLQDTDASEETLLPLKLVQVFLAYLSFTAPVGESLALSFMPAARLWRPPRFV